MTADAPGSRPIATPRSSPSRQRQDQPLSAEPLEVDIDALVQFLGVDAALISTEVDSEQSGDHRVRCRLEEASSRIALDKLGELENLGDGGHASIL